MKSCTTSCFSFECFVPSYGLRETVSTLSTSGCFRHSYITPSPTKPVTPVMMTFSLSILFYLNTNFARHHALDDTILAPNQEPPFRIDPRGDPSYPVASYGATDERVMLGEPRVHPGEPHVRRTLHI